MSIRDKDVRDAIDTLTVEFENKEDEVRELEEVLSRKEEIIEELQLENENLENRVQELEEALAEAYLTSQEGEECKESLVSQTSTDD